MTTIIGVFNISIYVLSSALLIFGLIQSKKHSFSGGFFFFLFLIIGKVYAIVFSLVISPLFQNFVDSHDHNGPLFMGLYTGEVVAFFTIISSNSISHITEFLAYGFLVIGLYRMWGTKKREKTKSVNRNLDQ